VEFLVEFIVEVMRGVRGMTYLAACSPSFNSLDD